MFVCKVKMTVAAAGALVKRMGEVVGTGKVLEVVLVG